MSEIEFQEGSRMNFHGRYVIPAPVDAVWSALNDPEILKYCIPGCEEIEKTSPQDFTAVAMLKIGPVKARFRGKVTLSDLDPPLRCRLSGEGQGGVAGFAKGDHGSTFGGNPVACAAALAVLDTIERDGLLAHVTSVGEHLAAGLQAVDHPLVAGVRGAGLWRAIVLTADVAPDVEAAARRAGFLVNAVQPDAIRLAPPLILSSAEADEFTAALPAILAGISTR